MSFAISFHNCREIRAYYYNKRVFRRENVKEIKYALKVGHPIRYSYFCDSLGIGMVFDGMVHGECIMVWFSVRLSELSKDLISSQ